MKGIRRQIILVLAVVFNIGVNLLGHRLGLYPQDTGKTSASVPNSLVPFDPTFAVWGVIFFGILVFAVYQALPANRGSRLEALALPFLLVNFFNGIWPIIWNNRFFGLSVIGIVAIFLSLLWLYLRLEKTELKGRERWLLKLPVSIFLAWITVATPVNITVWLTESGWEGPLPAATWASLLVAVLTIIGVMFLWSRRDVAYASVLVWAFYGIYAARPEVTPLAVTLAVGTLTLLAAAVLTRRARVPAKAL
jgi:hypothetical protein